MKMRVEKIQKIIHIALLILTAIAIVGCYFTCPVYNIFTGILLFSVIMTWLFYLSVVIKFYIKK